MPVTKLPRPKQKFPDHAHNFVRDALSEAQDKISPDQQSEKAGHISPRELLEGVRFLARHRYGMMATSVFRFWGVTSTADIGRIVFEMIELGELKKTENDQFSDFVDVFSFEDAFCSEYTIDVSKAFPA